MATVRLTPGNDTYTTQDGDEFVFALAGNDRITVEGTALVDFPEAGLGPLPTINVYGQEGSDTIIGHDSVYNDLWGGPGSDNITVGRIIGIDSYGHGGQGNDTLRGSTGFGGEAGVYLLGEGGNDRLFAHNEPVFDEVAPTYMVGGQGRDTMHGSDFSPDRFIFESMQDSVDGGQRDVILDFGREVDLGGGETQDGSRDRIDLSAIDANANRAGDQAFRFGRVDADAETGEASFYRRDDDVILVMDNGRREMEVEVSGFNAPTVVADFIL